MLLLFCFCKLQAQEKPVITMTTRMEIGKRIIFTLRPENGYKLGSICVSIDCGNGELIQKCLNFDYIYFNTKGDTIKIYLSSGSLGGIKCSKQGLTSLDVSNCKGLEELNCSENDLTFLNVSQNPKLKELYCSQNKINHLNLSFNPQLIELECSNNNLSALNLSYNSKLSKLNCNNNNLSALDLSRNPQLSELDCSNNNLSALDLSRNLQLSKLYCRYNNLSALDLSHNSRLSILYCHNNNLFALNLSNNPQLSVLNCEDNNLSELNLSKNKELNSLYCDNNSITTLDLSNNLALNGFYIYPDAVVTMPDKQKKLEYAQRKERENERLSKNNVRIGDIFGFSLGGGYTAMIGTQRDNRSHYQSMWHLDAGALILLNPEGNGWRDANAFFSLEGSINFLPMTLPMTVRNGDFTLPIRSKKVLPSLAFGITINQQPFGIDIKVAASPYFINPTIGINMVNFLKLNIGYSFGTKPFYDTQLSGFTIGIVCSFGTYPFCLFD